MECQVRDSTVFFEEVGVGRPLLFLHGRPLDHRHIASDMEPLFTNRCGWRRLYPDLPGMGKTPAANWITDQDQMLELVIGFMNNVAPGERFVVGGTSYGGYLARGLIYRLGDQIDGLLLIVPVVEVDAAKRQLPLPRVVHEDSAFLAALTPDEQDMRVFIVRQSMDLLAEFRKVFSPAGAIADQTFLQRLRQHDAFSFDVDILPTPFPAPALFLTGRHDNWCGYREAYRLLDNYPRASFVVLDSAGHALAVEQRTLFRALVNEWLDRVEEYVHTAHDY
ncbi:MAG TPA: alpha/beta hydrolase [Chloroflexi bacterium]|nr:alpha/beta hydrolase [Chloroflexota bacterium]